MSTGGKAVVIFAALALSGGAYYLLTPACACVTPDQKAHAQINADIERVVQAQQAIRGMTHQYVADVEHLGYQAEPHASTITFSNVTASSVHLEAKSILPGITCSMDITPGTAITTTAVCTGHVSNR